MGEPTALDLAAPEVAVERVVLDALRTLGYVWHVNGDSRRATPGLPDIVAVHTNVMVMLELKTEKGRLRPEQQEWFSLLLGRTLPKEWAGLVRMLGDPDDDQRDMALSTVWLAGVVRPRNLDDCIAWLTDAVR